MSSFRIDRQYVSFEAAEIHPDSLHTFKSEPVQEQLSPSLDAEELQRQRTELMKKARQEASESAQHILDRARAEAEEIIKKARNLAEDITDEAERSAREIKERAHRDGESEGRAEALESVRQQKADDAVRLKEMESKLQSDYDGLVDGINEDVVSLAMEIARKVIGVKLESSDEVFISIVNEALDRLKQAGFVTIHISSEDYARYFGSEPPENLINTSSEKVAVVEEEKYSKGDLVLESDGEVLDFSINKQLDKIEKAFAGE